MINLDELLADASLPEMTLPVCLDGRALGALHAAEVALLEAVERIEQGQQQSSLEAPDADDVFAQVKLEQDTVNAAQEAVRAAQVQFRLRAVPPFMWDTLVVSHPPRDGNATDDQAGYNTSSFGRALLRESLVDPKPTDAQWVKLVEVIHPPEMDRLVSGAVALSRRKSTLVPFSFGASAPTTKSARKPKQPAV